MTTPQYTPERTNVVSIIHNNLPDEIKAVQEAITQLNAQLVDRTEYLNMLRRIAAAAGVPYHEPHAPKE